MRTYNSALTSSSGHPVGLLTMIAEVCPPCHYWNMETASFKFWSHCFLTAEVEPGHVALKKKKKKTPEKFEIIYKKIRLLRQSAFDIHTCKIDCRTQTSWQLSASSQDDGDVEQGRNSNKLQRLTLLLQCPAVFQQEEDKKEHPLKRESLKTSHLVWGDREEAKVMQQLEEQKPS